jgi:hypothetical protein
MPCRQVRVHVVLPREGEHLACTREPPRAASTAQQQFTTTDDRLPAVHAVEP